MKHILKLKVDDFCEMAEISLDGKYLMSGNFWDFHPGCTNDSIKVSEKFGDFRGYHSLIKAISETFGKKGECVELIKEKYNFKKI